MLKTEFPAFIAVLIKLLTKLRQCQYLVGCIWFYVVLKSWTRAQPLVLSKTLLNYLLTRGKIRRNCKCHVLQMSGTQNKLMLAREWAYFCPKRDLFCFDIFSNFNNVFHFKMDLFLLTNPFFGGNPASYSMEIVHTLAAITVEIVSFSNS